LKTNLSFSFKFPGKNDLILTYNPPYFEAKNGSFESQISVNDAFKDQTVIFLAKFTRFGVNCMIVKDNNSQSLNIGDPKNFLLSEVTATTPPKTIETTKIGLFGFIEVDNPALLYRFFMEEKYCS